MTRCFSVYGVARIEGKQSVHNPSALFNNDIRGYIPSTGENRLKPIPVEEFGEHVQRMHADRDKFFESEYNVSEDFWLTVIRILLY